MKFSLSLSTILSSAVLLTLPACAPTVYFGAATSVTTSVAQERGVGGVLSDVEIKTKINTSWLEHDASLVAHLDLNVHQGKVLVTGTLDAQQQKVNALRCIWLVSGVKEVIDEIKVGGGEGLTGYASDSWISAKIKSALLFDENIKSINYSVTVFRGSVYLLGVAQTQTEMEAVIEHARNTSGVQQVTSHIRVKDAPPPGMEMPISPAPSNGQFEQDPNSSEKNGFMAASEAYSPPPVAPGGPQTIKETPLP